MAWHTELPSAPDVHVAIQGTAHTGACVATACVLPHRARRLLQWAAAIVPLESRWDIIVLSLSCSDGAA